MREERKNPISIGGASIIIIFTAFLISVIIVGMTLQIYKSYKINEQYIIETQSYYAADGEATVKRALIEQRLYQIYYSKAHINYDTDRIKKAIKDIKGIEIFNKNEKSILVCYVESINTRQSLSVELEIDTTKEQVKNDYFTIVNKWQVEAD
ncbi:hypothetical protein [Cellulosilyticum ruminicola]|uniref:hypothetical protein n=1 Tax=Cellulosilyticum ruminicola TaxID=425254 RepID=UPI0006D1AC4F|nr:hypothetical protein [Cellulosilyticum ruminicola]